MGLPGDVVGKLYGDTTCFFCNEKPATLRVQGETDSFGAEYNDICESCHAESVKEERERLEHHSCDWCKRQNGPVRHTRDVDEGMDGPVYLVCGECRKKQDEHIQQELAGWPLEEYYNPHPSPHYT